MCSSSLLSVKHVRIADDSFISSLINEINGNHHSVEDVFQNKPVNSLIVGHIVKAEMECHFLKVKKFFLNEVLPNGSKGKLFALFIFENSTEISASVDDYVIIHNPDISKNCLINFSHLLRNIYEFQVIIGYKNKKCITADKGDEQLLKVMVLKVNNKNVSEEFKEDLGLRNEDKSSESSKFIKAVPSLSKISDNTSCSDDKISIPAKKIRRLNNTDASKLIPEPMFILLNEIGCAHVDVNLFGIVVSVEEIGLFEFVGLIPADSDSCCKRCFKIFLRDESSDQRKHFLLNLVSDESDLPPLKVGFILRAMHVSVQLKDGEVTGCVQEGKNVDTFDCDIEAPVVSLRTCVTYDKEKKRIEELRNYWKIILSRGNEPEDSEINECVLDSEDSMTLRLESSSSDDDTNLEGNETCKRSTKITEPGNCENITPSNDSSLTFEEMWNYVLND